MPQGLAKLRPRGTPAGRAAGHIDLIIKSGPGLADHLGSDPTWALALGSQDGPAFASERAEALWLDGDGTMGCLMRGTTVVPSVAKKGPLNSAWLPVARTLGKGQG